jgi:hypothetical protein
MKSRSPISRFLLIFGTFWSAIVLGFDIFIGWSMIRQSATADWPTTTGHVLRSEIAGHDDGDGTTYSAEIEYEYEVDGREYQSDRIRLGGFTSTSDRDHIERIIARAPAGGTVPVYYNPDDPSEAVLTSGVAGEDYFIVLFLTPFNVIMLGIWMFAVEAISYALRRPPAGGAPIIRQGQRVHVRLPRMSPLFGAGLVALLISFISIFVVGFLIGSDPSLTAISIVWACILIPAGALYTWKKYRIGSGAKDLVVDRGDSMVSLPLTFGRREDVVIPLDRVRGIELERIEHRGKGSTVSHTWAPALVYVDPKGERQVERVAEWQSEERARALTDWLREELEITPPAQTSP